MKSKGFTLIELLAVIVVLGIIMLIAVTAVSNVITKSRLSSFSTSSKMLEKAASTYINASNTIVATGTTIAVLYSDLKSNGFMERVVDPITKNECTNSRVYVTNTNGTYTYKGALVCDNYMDIDAYSLVTNGDFSNGTTAWGGQGTTLVVSNGACVYTPTAQYGGAQQNYDNSTRDSVKGHKLYGRSNVKVASNIVYLVINDGLGQLTVNHSITDQFERLSGIWTVNVNATGLYIKVQDGRSSGWTQTIVDDFYIIDLTAIYGAGNEPTAAQMDKIMNNMGK